MADTEVVHVISPDGTVWPFPSLTVKQLLDAAALLAERQRVAIIQDGREVGASAAEVMDALRKARSETNGMHELIKSAFSWQGASDIIRMSAGGASADYAIANLPLNEISRLALRLINHELDESGKLNSRRPAVIQD